MSKTYYLGLDVHKEKISIAYTEARSRGEATYHGQCGGSVPRTEETLRKLAKKLEVPFKSLQVCYEAGPTGFVLSRRLIRLGLKCIVIAPTKTERKPGEKIKTDKRDAVKLAKLFRNGDLTSVRIPPASDEAVRDLCRARTDGVEDLSRNKQRLKSFLLRNGFLPRFPSWGPAYERPESNMRAVLREWEWEPVARALMAMKGFKEVAAMITLSELGDLTRFKHPRQLMAFLGLVPSEETTGSKRRQGAITKCGNGHARWLLIESAQAYRNPPKIAAALSERQEGQTRKIKELSWKAQNRLSKRYRRLKARGKRENKVIVAVARELCAFIWELHQIMSDRLPASEQAPHAS